MAIQPEISQLDSSEKKVSPKGKLFQKTNTEMSEVFESELEASSSSFIIDKIIELNPDVEIKTDSNKSVIFSSVSIDKLVLPEGFYYNLQNGITNKYNTQSNIYGFVHVYPIEYYHPNFI